MIKFYRALAHQIKNVRAGYWYATCAILAAGYSGRDFYCGVYVVRFE